MASAAVETICFQYEIPVILNTWIRNVYQRSSCLQGKEVWTPEMGEKPNVLMEPDNCVDKFSVFVKKHQTVVGHLKKGDPAKFAKTIFYFLRSDTYCNCYAEV